MINRDYANRVLFMLSFKQMSGYQLSKNIYHHGGQISSGTLVPILRNLEAANLIRYHKSGKRKIYALTEKGEQYTRSLREIRDELKKKMLVESMDQSLLYYDILTNFEDVEAIKRVLDRFGDLLLEIIKVGFKLEKKGSSEELDAIESRIKEILEAKHN